MGAITRSVGARGVNKPVDVTEIQQLLNKVPAAKGGAAPPSWSSAPAVAPRWLAFIEDAFHKHFKLILDASKADAAHPNTKVFNPVADKTFLPTIRANFRAIQGVVINHSKFDLITAATAVADGAPGIAAYVKATGGNIQVSPAFNSPARGPNCQARDRRP